MNLRRTAATRLMTISRIIVGPQSFDKTLLWVLGVIRVRGDAGRSRGSIILRIDALRNQARQRRRDRKFQSSRGLDCSGVITQHD
jgi:hypothetical protein